VDLILVCLQRCKSWEAPDVVSALKNELRPLEKIVDGKTRHFNPYPFAQLIVQRMYVYPLLLTFLALGPERTS